MGYYILVSKSFSDQTDLSVFLQPLIHTDGVDLIPLSILKNKTKIQGCQGPYPTA